MLLTDVAISAPFAKTGSNEPGSVFIYHSAPNMLLSNEPQQVGAKLNYMMWVYNVCFRVNINCMCNEIWDIIDSTI